jgi:membrane-associated phospholipid phosphatase
MSVYKVFSRIFQHVRDSIVYNHGLNYVLACILTYIIASSGFDVAWFQYSMSHPWIFTVGFIPVIIGFFIPVFIPIIVYVSGLLTKQTIHQRTGLALAQASILGLGISSFIKVFTGRLPPGQYLDSTPLTGFRFGFFQGGAFNGWPSSHTTIAFAMAVTLIELYPDNKTIKIVALAYALFIGLGVSTNIHWFSDAVAGALIGYAIGQSVGKGFKKMYTSTTL